MFIRYDMTQYVARLEQHTKCKITFLSEFSDYKTVKRDLKRNFRLSSEHETCFCVFSPCEDRLDACDYLPFTPASSIKNMKYAYIEFISHDDESEHFLSNSVFYYDEMLDVWIHKVIASVECDLFYFVNAQI